MAKIDPYRFASYVVTGLPRQGLHTRVDPYFIRRSALEADAVCTTV